MMRRLRRAVRCDKALISQLVFRRQQTGECKLYDTVCLYIVQIVYSDFRFIVVVYGYMI